MRSQNGWPVIESPSGTRLWKIPVRSGPPRTYRLQPGHAGFVLCYVVLRFHETIEAINEGIWDEWGWAVRNVRGSSSVSNHSSGTAVDVNATRHPLGVRNTFKRAWQYAKIKALIAYLGGVVRSGTQYQNRKDEMHWEINVTPESGRVQKLAARLASTPRGKRVLAYNPDYQRAVVHRSGTRSLHVGASGADVTYVQRRVGASPADGSYGPKTEAKVRDWKRAHVDKFPRMTLDGNVGKTTWQALGVKVRY